MAAVGGWRTNEKRPKAHVGQAVGLYSHRVTTPLGSRKRAPTGQAPRATSFLRSWTASHNEVSA